MRSTGSVQFAYLASPVQLGTFNLTRPNNLIVCMRVTSRIIHNDNLTNSHYRETAFDSFDKDQLPKLLIIEK